MTYELRRTILEHHDCWDTSDSILSGHRGTLIGVELYSFEFPIVLLGDFVDNWGNHAARTAPWSPEVH